MGVLVNATPTISWGYSRAPDFWKLPYGPVALQTIRKGLLATLR